MVEAHLEAIWEAVQSSWVKSAQLLLF